MYCTIEPSRNLLYMRPDELSSGQGETSSVNPQQQAAARLVRSQIDTIYGETTSPEPSQQQSEDINPYQKTHSDHTDIHEDQWKQYHTAWQNYYQKYYEAIIPITFKKPNTL